VEKHGRDGQATDDNTVHRMHFACWVTDAANTHSEYVVLIACPMQQWTSVVGYMFIACFVKMCDDR